MKLWIVSTHPDDFSCVAIIVVSNDISTQPITAKLQCIFPCHSNLWYKTHLSRRYNCWQLGCSWSIACRRCPNYIFIIYLTPGLNGLDIDNCKKRWETFTFWNLVRLILEIFMVPVCFPASFIWKERVLCDGMVARGGRFCTSMAPKALVGTESSLTTKMHNRWPLR